MHRNSYWKKHPAAIRDFVIVGVLSVIVFVVAGMLEIFEFLHQLILEHDRWQLDELFILALFLAFAMCIVAMRRLREMNRLLEERELTLVELNAAKERAEAASRVKSEFLANMSHEIRTPMNAILGMTGITLDSNLTREQTENLQIVRSSADSLLQILNDILDFSKVEVGKLELEYPPISICASCWTIRLSRWLCGHMRKVSN